MACLIGLLTCVCVCVSRSIDSRPSSRGSRRRTNGRSTVAPRVATPFRARRPLHPTRAAELQSVTTTTASFVGSGTSREKPASTVNVLLQCHALLSASTQVHDLSTAATTHPLPNAVTVAISSHQRCIYALCLTPRLASPNVIRQSTKAKRGVVTAIATPWRNDSRMQGKAQPVCPRVPASRILCQST